LPSASTFCLTGPRWFVAALILAGVGHRDEMAETLTMTL